MYIKKRYGESRITNCPFCGKQAVTTNPEGVPVCLKHKGKKLPIMKCACGEWLDVQSGKWGTYFNCMRCGNINFSKGMDMNPQVREE